MMSATRGQMRLNKGMIEEIAGVKLIMWLSNLCG
jgi:hypothetical protein